MKRKFIYICMAISVSGCLDTPGKVDASATDPQESIGNLNAEFVDLSKLQQESGQIANSFDPSLGGVYFGELEIVAYNYRPGEEVQRWEPHNGFEGQDWSYWVLLQSGHDKARNIVLRPNQRLNISALDEKLNPPVDKEFIKKVGQFSVDFFEVAVYQPGLIYNHEFHFNGVVTNQNPLYKYPDFTSFPQFISHPGVGGFAGFPGHGSVNDATERVSVFSVIFARDDWFPEPVLVYFSDRNTLAGSSKTLTAFQATVLASMVSQSTQRRYLDHLIIVPYSRKVVAMKHERNCEDGARTSLQAQVSFDLSDLISEDSVFSGDSSIIKFKRDGNQVPFGINLSFKSNNSKYDSLCGRTSSD
jgi:hypothetical protein